MSAHESKPVAKPLDDDHLADHELATITGGGGLIDAAIPLLRREVFPKPWTWHYEPNVFGRLLGVSKRLVNSVPPGNPVRELQATLMDGMYFFRRP